ncbi:MAG: dTMP kinase [Gammaproteobacteria bacterium]|nr:dTMP kinase [Gammaproteobacteria bacterium]
MDTGKFITVEGIEGVGKSTNIDRLMHNIEQHGHKVIKTREPGGTPTAEMIRGVVLGHADEPIPDIAELLLMFASRSLLVENVIRPALTAGTWVVSDRFVDASRAYQGGGRGVPMERVNLLADWVLGDLRPDLTILLDAPVETGLARAGHRGDPDRLDVEKVEFYHRVRETYLGLVAAEPERFVVVDASGDRDQVKVAIDAVAAVLLGEN